MKQTGNKSDIGPKKRRRRVFKDFAEYWHYVKVLSDDQRKVIVDSLTTSEQRALKTSYDQGGWEDLFMRNTCDSFLKHIQKDTNIDMLDLRFKILKGHSQLMYKQCWDYINGCFNKIPWKHIAYIFDGITVEEYDDDYIKLIKFKSAK